MTTEQELELETRFLDAVQSQPGITVEEVARKINILATRVQQGCDYAVAEGLLFVFRGCYFATVELAADAVRSYHAANVQEDPFFVTDSKPPKPPAEAEFTVPVIRKFADTQPKHELTEAELEQSMADRTEVFSQFIQQARLFLDNKRLKEFLEGNAHELVHGVRSQEFLMAVLEYVALHEWNMPMPKMTEKQYQAFQELTERHHREWCELEERIRAEELNSKDGEQKSGQE
jgi:hypothetical protein